MDKFFLNLNYCIKYFVYTAAAVAAVGAAVGAVARAVLDYINS